MYCFRLINSTFCIIVLGVAFGYITSLGLICGVSYQNGGMERIEESEYTDVRTNLTSVKGDDMARTMTVDVGDELREFIDSLVTAGDYRTQSEVMRDALRLLREKQAESRLQGLRDLLAEGISSGDAKPWNKDAFLKHVRARTAK